MALSLILGVDTAARNGSLALVRCAEPSCETLGLAPLAGGSYSADLIPQLAAMMERLGIVRQALQGFAVVSGPGSFTGLRVGLSTVKALAEILQRPIEPAQAQKLLAAGKTDLLEKFISKAGKPFSAFLVMGETGKVTFDFPPRDSD